jgi:hypothetical protein
MSMGQYDTIQDQSFVVYETIRYLEKMCVCVCVNLYFLEKMLATQKFYLVNLSHFQILD